LIKHLCPVCEEYPDRVAEIIAHRGVITWAEVHSRKFSVMHSIPSKKRDAAGIDITVIDEQTGRKILIQVKKFRILDEVTLEARLKRLRWKSKKPKYRDHYLPDSESLKRHLYSILKRYKNIRLFINDKEIRNGFKAIAREHNLYEILRREDDYQKLLDIFSKIEPYIAIFEKALLHKDKYPDVKVLLIADLISGEKTALDKLSKEIPDVMSAVLNTQK